MDYDNAYDSLAIKIKNAETIRKRQYAMTMTPEILELKIQEGIPDAKIIIDSDGTHFFVTVISTVFAGKTRVAKQQLVYRTVEMELQNGALHALSLQTYTPPEWEEMLTKNRT